MENIANKEHWTYKPTHNIWLASMHGVEWYGLHLETCFETVAEAQNSSTARACHWDAFNVTDPDAFEAKVKGMSSAEIRALPEYLGYLPNL